MITRGRETVRKAVSRFGYGAWYERQDVIELVTDRVMAGERVVDAWRNEWRLQHLGPQKENPA